MQAWKIQLLLITISVLPSTVFGQQGVLGTNLIVNPGADQGPAGTAINSVVSIPGWTLTGTPTVLPYGLSGLLAVNQPSPSDHSFQYFAGSGNSAIAQDIDVTSSATAINTGNVRFTASAYLGTVIAYVVSGTLGSAQMTVAFKNANGQTFDTVALGPISEGAFYQGGIFLQQQIGLVPSGTTRITVSLIMIGQNGEFGAADSLSLRLDMLGTNPQTVLGPNLVVNPGAETGSGAPAPAVALNIPGWAEGLPNTVVNGPSVAPYGGTAWIAATDPGPLNRGANVFGGAAGDMYQDIDVSSAASSIDGGNVTYQLSAWLGGISGSSSPTLAYTFFDWTGKQLAPSAQLGPATHNGTGLILTTHSEILPAGTRRVHLDMNFPSAAALADNISFSLSPAGAPKITPSGIVPVFSTSTTVQSGSWISIYGTNLAASNALWSGNFPQSLGNVSVTVDSTPAYLWFVSPTQINLQVPDDASTGTVTVVVTNQNGSDSSTVTLGTYGPSFSLYSGNKYVAAIVSLPVGNPGNSGFGYDYIGPAGALPFPSRPVKAGETISLYGVGFGPTSPHVSAGQIYSGVAPSLSNPVVTVGGVNATVTFAGIIEAGLFQINVVVPAAGTGDQPLLASIGGLATPANVFLTLQ